LGLWGLWGLLGLWGLYEGLLNANCDSPQHPLKVNQFDIKNQGSVGGNTA
jgi:hypothetical protein